MLDLRRWTTPLRRFWLIIAILSMAAVLVVLFLLPVPQSFSLQSTNVGDLMPTSCASVQFPAGAVVSFHWSASSVTTLNIAPCNSGSDQPVYTSTGTSGSGTFTADGGLYFFGQGCPTGCGPEAQVAGSYSGPIL